MNQFEHLTEEQQLRMFCAELAAIWGHNKQSSWLVPLAAEIYHFIKDGKSYDFEAGQEYNYLTGELIVEQEAPQE